MDIRKEKKLDKEFIRKILPHQERIIEEAKTRSLSAILCSSWCWLTCEEYKYIRNKYFPMCIDILLWKDLEAHIQ